MQSYDDLWRRYGTNAMDYNTGHVTSIKSY